MLCMDLKLVQILRGGDRESNEARGRSKSVCVSSFRHEEERDYIDDGDEEVGALKQFYRRASSAFAAATDLLTSRRGTFSRKRYGSVEQILQSELQSLEPHTRRFRVENGESIGEKDEMFGSPSTPILENPEFQTRWYFKYFLGRMHQNYTGIDSSKCPFFLSIVSSEGTIPSYRIILFTKTGAQKISLPYTHSKPLTVKQILANFTNMDKLEKMPKEVFSLELQKSLLVLEEQEGSVNFKFGVIYMKQGQMSDDEMLSNENGSEYFDDFLSLLGEKINLKGWTKYRGGLDTKGDMTGQNSVYTIYEGHEIMFHVSTLLPHTRGNRQQLERKRHIGNDIINIIFMDPTYKVKMEMEVHQEAVIQEETCSQSESEQSGQFLQQTDESVLFNPNWIKSQFTHVFAFVTLDKQQNYQLTVYSEENVPLFGPTLPCPAVFTDPRLFRDFLLVKLINGEKATFNTPVFRRKRERTLGMLIKDLYEENVTDTRMSILSRRAFSDVLSYGDTSSRLRDNSRRHTDFVALGQALKLEAIIRGDAPTSLVSAPRILTDVSRQYSDKNDDSSDTTQSKKSSTDSTKNLSIVINEPYDTKEDDRCLSGSIEAAAWLFRRAPWQAHCFYANFPYQDVSAGDSWGSDKLFIATEDHGAYLMEESNLHRLVFDRTLIVRQLNVLDAHGIMVIRATGLNSKSSTLYVFRLREFESIRNLSNEEDTETMAPLPRSKWHCKKNKLERTKGCHLYGLSKPGGQRLRLCVALGKKLLLMQWKHTEAWSVWCSDVDTDTVEGFLFIKEITLSEIPTILTMMDACDSTDKDLICIGFRNHWEILDETSGQSENLFTMDTAKVNLVAAIDLYEDEDVELLLCYNNTCHFKKLGKNRKNNTETDMHWTTVPTDIVCVFPYIIAFTADTMEIRLIVNGNLVHTSSMPQLKMIASKEDIFFSTTAPEVLPQAVQVTKSPSEKKDLNDDRGSKNSLITDIKPLRLYRMPLSGMSGQHSDSRYRRQDQTWSQTLRPPTRSSSRSASTSPVPLSKEILFNKGFQKI